MAHLDSRDVRLSPWFLLPVCQREWTVAQSLPGPSGPAPQCCLDCFLLTTLVHKRGEHHWRAHKLFEGVYPIFATPWS